MKVHVNLPSEDVRFLDEYAMEHGLDSRSAVLHRAVRLLQDVRLAAAYESAWEHWAKDREADAWESTSSDGLRDAIPP